MKYYQDQWEY